MNRHYIRSASAALGSFLLLGTYGAQAENGAPVQPPRPPAEEAPAVALTDPAPVVTVQPVEPRYAPPASLKQFRYAKPPVPPEAPVVASPAPASAPVALPAATELAGSGVATVKADPDAPRYARPKSLDQWGSGRTMPLYEDANAAPWQASPSEPRLQNAAVSCNYKDEGGVRGRVMLVINDYKLSRFNARIDMPNGGTCRFDAKKMRQTNFKQGIALQSPNDACVVRMWEQDHRITIAAYSCYKQCSKGSFSYLWPILMDTRVGTCY